MGMIVLGFRLRLLRILVLILGGFCPNVFAQRAEEFMPINPNIRFTYLATYTTKAGLRTTQETVLISKGINTGTLEAIYLIDEDDLGKSNPIIGSNMLGLGVMAKGKNGIYTIDCFWFEDISKIHSKNAYLFLKDNITPGQNVRIVPKEGGATLVVDVIGFEPITVPAGRFDNSLKLRIQEIWPEKKYDGYAWLAKGIGVVKRIRSTGRVEELVGYGQLTPTSKAAEDSAESDPSLQVTLAWLRDRIAEHAYQAPNDSLHIEPLSFVDCTVRLQTYMNSGHRFQEVTIPLSDIKEVTLLPKPPGMNIALSTGITDGMKTIRERINLTDQTRYTNMYFMYVGSEDMSRRMTKAFRHAISLCSKREPF